MKLSLSGIFCLLFFAPLVSAFAEKPNVMFFFTDDQRHDTIHALGNESIRTPNIDSLVENGVAFTNAYIMGGSSPAVCSPSRACLFSGLTLWNVENQGPYGYEISEKYKTMPEVFRDNGYVTFGTGKNEPGIKGHFNRSFSTGDKILFKGMTRSQFNLQLYPYSPTNDYSKANRITISGKHSAEVYADACINFLESQQESEKPFFAYLAFQTPHDPRQAPPAYHESYNAAKMKPPVPFMPQHPFDNGMLKIRDERLAPFPRTEAVIQKHMADYYATISHTDDQIGRVLEALGIEIVSDRFMDFYDPWGNRIEIVGYDGIHFSKTTDVLRGMGLSGLSKTDKAREELNDKGMGPGWILALMEQLPTRPRA